MPTYDYECSACEHRFEHFQKITDDPLAVCPKCKRKKLIRLFGTGAAVMFKGSGFYQTDYRSESYKRAASSDQASSGGKAEGSSSSSGESTGGSGGATEATPKSTGSGKSTDSGKSKRGKPKAE